jgi:hypothetical protein
VISDRGTFKFAPVVHVDFCCCICFSVCWANGRGIDAPDDGICCYPEAAVFENSMKIKLPFKATTETKMLHDNIVKKIKLFLKIED